MRASVLLALMVSGAGALSITRRGVAARVGVAVTTGEFLRTRDARAAYDYARLSSRGPDGPLDHRSSASPRAVPTIRRFRPARARARLRPRSPAP